MKTILEKDGLKILIEAFLDNTYHVTNTNQAFLDNVLCDLKDYFLMDTNTGVLDYFTDEELKDIIKVHFGVDAFRIEDYFN